VARALGCSVLAICLVVSAHARAQDLPYAPVSSAPIPASSEGTELLWPARTPDTALAHPVLRRGRDMGLISVGILGLSVGMIIGIGIASADLAGRGNCHEFAPPSFVLTQVQCGTAPFALIPFAGSVLVGTVSFHGSVTAETILPGTLALAPQIMGLVFLLLGMHGFTEDLGSRDDAVAVNVVPLLSSSELGLRVSMSL
jgi:hypothetical protein